MRENETQKPSPGTWVNYKGERLWLIGYTEGGAACIQYFTAGCEYVQSNEITPWIDKQKVKIPKVYIYRQLNGHIFASTQLYTKQSHKLIKTIEESEVEVEI